MPSDRDLPTAGMIRLEAMLSEIGLVAVKSGTVMYPRSGGLSLLGWSSSCIRGLGSRSAERFDELLRLCNHCWEDQNIPKSWRIAKVVLLFKKGDSSLPENYRPISLLPIGYKVLAALIHRRLLDGGVDQKIRETQYGCRPKRNCADALTLVKRIIDAAHEQRTESLCMIFLDWAKPFDRIRSWWFENRTATGWTPKHRMGCCSA